MIIVCILTNHSKHLDFKTNVPISNLLMLKFWRGQFLSGSETKEFLTSPYCSARERKFTTCRKVRKPAQLPLSSGREGVWTICCPVILTKREIVMTLCLEYLFLAQNRIGQLLYYRG